MKEIDKVTYARIAITNAVSLIEKNRESMDDGQVRELARDYFKGFTNLDLAIARDLLYWDIMKMVLHINIGKVVMTGILDVSSPSLGNKTVDRLVDKLLVAPIDEDSKTIT